MKTLKGTATRVIPMDLSKRLADRTTMVRDLNGEAGMSWEDLAQLTDGQLDDMYKTWVES